MMRDLLSALWDNCMRHILSLYKISHNQRQREFIEKEVTWDKLEDGCDET